MMFDPGKGRKTKELWVEQLLSMTRAERERDLSLQLGVSHSPGSGDQLHLSLSELQHIRELAEEGESDRIYHQAVDHFLRSSVEPSQTVLATWMNGARAHINNQKIPFNEVVTWCQNMDDNEARSLLTREVRALCRFLTPFNQTTWETLFTTLSEELGYPDYITFCEEKRNVSLAKAAAEAKLFLDKTREPYRKQIGPLLLDITGQSLEQASRFDGIYLMGLRYLDRYFPERFSVDSVVDFFHETGFSLISDEDRLIIHQRSESKAHPYCIPISIPEEIHIIVGPVRGWLDLEALCHELGHAMTFLYTDPDLPPEQVNFFQSAGITESFAFLFQRVCMSRSFLCEVLGLSADKAEEVSSIHKIKWLTLARRYGTKLLIEVENFQKDLLVEGEQYYADSMQKETFFSYGPETYLFDLMPDFYSLDYFQAFLGSAAIERYLKKTYGNRWYGDAGAVSCLQGWWRDTPGSDLNTFVSKTTGSSLQADAFTASCSPCR